MLSISIRQIDRSVDHFSDSALQLSERPRLISGRKYRFWLVVIVRHLFQPVMNCRQLRHGAGVTVHTCFAPLLPHRSSQMGSNMLIGDLFRKGERQFSRRPIKGLDLFQIIFIKEFAMILLSGRIRLQLPVIGYVSYLGVFQIFIGGKELFYQWCQLLDELPLCFGRSAEILCSAQLKVKIRSVDLQAVCKTLLARLKRSCSYLLNIVVQFLECIVFFTAPGIYLIGSISGFPVVAGLPIRTDL